MKKIRKISITGILITAAVLLLVGCKRYEFNAVRYVEVCLDLMAKGDIDAYMDMLNLSEERARETYENHINNLVDSFVPVELSGSLMEDYRQFCRDFFAKAKYKVKNAEQMKNKNGKDGYEVTVETQRMKGMYKDLSKEAMSEVNIWLSKQTEQFSTEEYFEAAYGILLDVLYRRLDNIAYDEPETIIVEVLWEDNSYGLADDAYMQLSDALIFKDDDY